MQSLSLKLPSSPSFPTLTTLMKRKRSISTPPHQNLTTPHLTKPLKNAPFPSKTPRKSLSKSLNTPTPPIPPQNLNWVSLNLSKNELSLHLTFPTGQTFRWKKTGQNQYTGVIKSYLVSLKHAENDDVAYCFHNLLNEREHDDARLALLDFLNVGVSLTELWECFSASDQRFAMLAPSLAGARVLRQGPSECLFQFLCSSNNNIGRITKMVDYISSLGCYLGSADGFEFFEFPTLERLALVSEQQLREAGFGYRAKYVVGTVKALQLKPGGGSEWLSSLRESNLEDVIADLCTLPGVGPKVAACIALFSLDQHHAVPVDTHVWKIATRYLMPELAGLRLTSKLCSRVAEAFVTKYGKYAGWAQTLLFVSELPSQKSLIPSQDCISSEKKITVTKEDIDSD